MTFRWNWVRGVTACGLMAIFATPQNLVAQTHIVSPAAESALKKAHMNPQRVNEAVSRLNNQELAELAARASKAQADFAAGNISDRDLLIILVAVAALILIIVAVR